MNKTKKSEEKVKIKNEFLDTIKDLEQMTEITNLVKDNRIVFNVKGINYRVRKPNYNEQLEIEKFRRKEYLRLINDDTMFFRKQWIEKYRKKGIYIDKMETDIKRLQSEIEKLMLRLAKTDNKTDIEKLKNQIEKLRNEQATINIEKTDLLSYSVEDQLLVAVNSYYTYIVLEKQTKDKKWEKAFNNYDDFMDSKNKELISKAFYYVNYIIYSEIL